VRGIRIAAIALAVGLIAGCPSQPPPGVRERMANTVSWKPPKGFPKPPRPDPAGGTVKLSRAARERLERDGFVILGDREPLSATYAYIELMQQPLFISADVPLYAFHCLFEGALVEHEKQTLAPVTKRLVEALYRAAQAQSKDLRGSPALAEAAHANVEFLAVAAALLGLPADADQTVVDRIHAASPAGYYPDEDFTFYRVRGHYADEPALQGYYLATRWLSRHILPIIPGHRDGAADADRRLRQAVLLGRLLAQDAEAKAAWQQLYDEWDLLIGRPDSFTPPEVLQEANRALGADLAANPAPLESADAVARLRKHFAQPRFPESRIAGIPQYGPGDAPAKYCQLLGERYAVDSEVFQRVCFPHSEQTLPSGLDVAAALWGSPRALQHLQPRLSADPAYAQALQAAQADLSTYGEGDQAPSVYTGWLCAIRPLLGGFSQGCPAFLRTPAWQDKELNTALAAWTMARHDFILTAKQANIPGGLSRVPPLVEPAPETYGRLAGLCERLMKVEGFGDRFGWLGKLCRQLETVAQAELAGKEAPEASELSSLGMTLLAQFLPKVAPEEPRIVADVATDSLHRRVLHAAVGPFNYVVVRYTPPPGSPGFTREPGQPVDAVGIVLRYYEFERPDFQRLTDQEWREMVKRGQHRDLVPEWAQGLALQD